MTEATDHDTATPAARHGTRRRVVNAYLRESGVHDVVPGPLTVPLPATGGELRLTAIHASPAGHHDYAELPETVVPAILDELEARTGFAGRRVLGAQIAGSTDNTARFLAVAHPRGDDNPVRAAEQNVLFGHPFHPTPKSSEGFEPADLRAYAPEFGVSFRLHHLAVADELVIGHGTMAVPDAVAAVTPTGFTAIPVHPWQARHLARNPTVRALVDDGAIVSLGERGEAVYPTSSLRTVCDSASGTSWKLPLHVRVTNFVRNTPAEHLRRATDAMHVVDRLPAWDGFHVVREPGFRALAPAAVGDDLAAELNALHREAPPGSPLVLAGLLDDPSRMDRWLRGSGDPVEWLRRFVDLAQRPLLSAFAWFGVAFEAHAQNSLVRLDADGLPVGFAVRDMEGVAIDRTREPDLPPDSPALYDHDEAWRRLCYHAITNQLAHVVHALAVHAGVPERLLWTVARDQLRDLPAAERLLAAPTLPAKANLLSRFTQRGERPYFVEIPNPLQKGPHR